MNEAHEAAGYLLNDSQAMIFLAAWIALVLVHGFYRSTGEAKQDPILPSGPPGVLDRIR
jgi:hypothetical protein